MMVPLSLNPPALYESPNSFFACAMICVLALSGEVAIVLVVQLLPMTIDPN